MKHVVGQGRALQRRPAWQRQALLLLAFVLLAAPLVGFRAVNDRPLSLYDEWQYADRVHQVTEGNVWMSDGEVVSPWGEMTRACRGIERVALPTTPPCTVPPDARPTPNYAGPDPAPYFIATGFGSEVLLALGVVGDPLVAARLVGIVWAGLSMWTLWLLARAFGATRTASAVAASAVLLVPTFLQQYIHVTPHALDIPVGSFTALAALKFLRRDWPAWVLPLASLTIVGVKGSNIVIAVAVGVTFAAIVAWPGIERSDRLRALVGGTVLTASTVAFLVAYQAALDATRVADYDPPGDFVKEEIIWDAVIIDIPKFLTPWSEGPLVAPSAWLTLAMGGTAMVVWAGLVPGLAPYVRQFAPGYLLGAALGAVLLDVLVFVTTQQQFGVHLRYGLAVFPIGLAFLALLLRTRTAIVLAVAGLVVYAAMPALLSLDTVAL